MRVAIVSDYYYPQLGGITEHVHGQATELVRRGHDVVVVTPRLLHAPKTVDGDDLPERSFELVRIGYASPFYANRAETLVSLDPGPRRRMRRFFDSWRADVVHVHNPFGVALPAAAVLSGARAVKVGTLHSVFPDRYLPLRVLGRPAGGLLRKLDARVAVSQTVVDSIGSFLPDLDFQVIPNGVDTSFFSPAAEPLGSVPGKSTIVFVGRFDPRNGVKTMIHAFTQLREMRDDVRLVVVGDGPLRPLVERMVPANITDDVVFVGRVNRLRPRYLAAADVLCTPCSLASFGMVLLEGMSAGLPLVASKLAGFELVMRDGVDGVMIDRADDAAGFAAALDRMLDDPAAARKMGAAGRERALSTFSWPIVVDRLEELYGQLLGAERRSTTLSRAASLAA